MLVRTMVTLGVILIFSMSIFADSHKKKDIVDTAVSAGTFNTLVAAVKAAGLVETLKGDGPFTVFAPTDDAFAKLPEGTVESLLKPENKDKLVAILTYHVVAGNYSAEKVLKADKLETVNGQSIMISKDSKGAKVNQSGITATDIMTSNGVIHVIDNVLLPEDKKSSKGKKDIVDTAVNAGTFNTLVAAVKAAGLVETLKGDGPFTVFAPTDDAFAKLPKGTVESLLKPENKDKLVAILTYHVVAGKFTAEKVLKSDMLKTVNGQSIKINKDDKGAKVNMSGITATDIMTSNGVIHVLDTVLMPEDDKTSMIIDDQTKRLAKIHGCPAFSEVKTSSEEVRDKSLLKNL